jgi:hypothetical protein
VYRVCSSSTAPESRLSPAEAEARLQLLSHMLAPECVPHQRAGKHFSRAGGAIFDRSRNRILWESLSRAGSLGACSPAWRHSSCYSPQRYLTHEAGMSHAAFSSDTCSFDRVLCCLAVRTFWQKAPPCPARLCPKNSFPVGTCQCRLSRHQ